MPTNYCRRWALWIAEVKDDARRLELIEWAMSSMEKAWRHGIDSGLYAKPSQNESSQPVKKGTKREKIDDILLFDDMIDTSTIVLSKTDKFNFKLTNKEFRATGASIDAVNLRIATRDVAAGNKLFEDYVETLENGKINISDWKSRTTTTDANPLGRDLLVYALHEVQLAKAQISQLKGYLSSHKQASQKRNTNNRIAEFSAKINHWLALAIELDKVRPKDETDIDNESEVEIRAASASDSILQGSFLPAEKISKDDPVTPMSSAPDHEDESNLREDVLPSKQKLKIPFKNLVQNGHAHQQVRPPLTPKTPIVQRVRLSKPKPSTYADGQHKQDSGSKQPLQATAKPTRKRKIAPEDSSDGEYKIEGNTPVREHGRRRRSRRQKTRTNYVDLAG